MKYKDEDPDNLDGLGGMLPADVLKMLNEALERLHRAGHINHGSKIEVVYVASGGQHVETQYISLTPNPSPTGEGDLKGREKGVEGQSKATSETPPPEAMVRAVEKTMAQGYWWASTAWAVVYRVYQMRGYGGGFSQFVKEVATWPRTRQWEMECNFDAVQKPVSSGRLSGMPEMWRANGAQEQATKLAFALMEELRSC